MPRFALFSDVHGNLEALEAVLGDIARHDVDHVVCLGDVVGYGPDPSACVEMVYDACDAVVIGNHEHAVLADSAMARFSPAARLGVEHARAAMGPEHLRLIRAWPTRLTLDGLACTHGSFFHDHNEYVTDRPTAARSFRGATFEFAAFGHTHIPSLFSAPIGRDVPQDFVRAAQLAGGPTVALPACHRHMINPGSVGQPRDRNPDAAWALLDTTARTVRVRRVAYDAAVVSRKIRMAGLPDRLGERLLVGA